MKKFTDILNEQDPPKGFFDITQGLSDAMKALDNVYRQITKFDPFSEHKAMQKKIEKAYNIAGEVVEKFTEIHDRKVKVRKL
jgi:hypothetical protein